MESELSATHPFSVLPDDRRIDAPDQAGHLAGALPWNRLETGQGFAPTLDGLEVRPASTVARPISTTRSGIYYAAEDGRIAGRTFEGRLMQGNMGEAVVKLGLDRSGYMVKYTGVEHTLGVPYMQMVQALSWLDPPTRALLEHPDFQLTYPPPAMLVEVKSTRSPLCFWVIEGGYLDRMAANYPGTVICVVTIPGAECFAVPVNDLAALDLPRDTNGLIQVNIPKFFGPWHEFFPNLDQATADHVRAQCSAEMGARQ